MEPPPREQSERNTSSSGRLSAFLLPPYIRSQSLSSLSFYLSVLPNIALSLRLGQSVSVPAGLSGLASSSLSLYQCHICLRLRHWSWVIDPKEVPLVFSSSVSGRVCDPKGRTSTHQGALLPRTNISTVHAGLERDFQRPDRRLTCPVTSYTMMIPSAPL